MKTIFVFGLILWAQQAPAQVSTVAPAADGRRLFTKETFGGNGRTCATCHSLDTGTVSPDDAQKRFRANPRDPLFLFDGSDDGQGRGVSRILQDATILITIPLPPNVSLGDDAAARSVVLRRAIPSTHNTPALDRILMLDGREPDLPTQALHAIQRHGQVSGAIQESDLLSIAQFELTEQFFSSDALQKFAAGGRAPKLPAGHTDSEKRGRLFFEDAPVTGPDFKKGACAICHSGPMLNQTNQFFPVAGLVFSRSTYRNSMPPGTLHGRLFSGTPTGPRLPCGVPTQDGLSSPASHLRTAAPRFYSTRTLSKYRLCGASRTPHLISTTIRRRHWKTWLLIMPGSFLSRPPLPC
jgi:hypothetical protein